MKGQRARRRFATPRLEGLEDRRVLTAAGSVSVTLSQHMVDIQGTPGNDYVAVQYTQQQDGTKAVQITDNQGNVLGSFAAGTVQQVVFHGYDGDDTFVNNTKIDSDAYGGNGNDVLAGGGG